ncbi:MAG: hypothetical protein H7A25_25690 [Leptospiraceae bacterium]|nr:hypothetical protein [Leptospiraceae bacterium]MCP5503317.1 hypothetical protein [Leptospiraceae bacterium]
MQTFYPYILFGLSLPVFFYLVFQYRQTKDKTSIFFSLFILSNPPSWMLFLPTYLQLYLSFSAILYFIFSTKYLLLEYELEEKTSYSKLLFFSPIVFLFFPFFPGIQDRLNSGFILFYFIIFSLMGLRSLLQLFKPAIFMLFASCFHFTALLVLPGVYQSKIETPLISNGFEILGVLFLFLGMVYREYSLLSEKQKAREVVIQTQEEVILSQKDSVIQSSEKVQDLKESLNDAKILFHRTAEEIKTPGEKILGLIQITLSSKKRKTIQEYKNKLSEIQKRIEQIVHLSKILEDFSSFEQKKIQLQTGPVNLKATATVALDLLSPILSRKNLYVRNNIPEELPPVLGDENRLIQVFHNLLENAIRFTNEGEITIEAKSISLKVEEENRRDLLSEEKFIEVKVSDTGVGIPEEFLERIFMPYEKEEAISSESKGLGLSITRQIVELHGGKIHANSKVGEGACFIFTLIPYS